MLNTKEFALVSEPRPLNLPQGRPGNSASELLPRLQNGPSGQAEWRDLVVTDRKDQVVPKHLVEAGSTKVGDEGYRQSRMER